MIYVLIERKKENLFEVSLLDSETGFVSDLVRRTTFSRAKNTAQLWIEEGQDAGLDISKHIKYR